jgi:hypothetical protein
MTCRIKTPRIKELAALIRHIKKYIHNDYIAEGDNKPGIDLTIGVDVKTGKWSWQTGDNSYTGAAYCYKDWAVTRVYRRTNSVDCARDIISQIKDVSYYRD